VVLQGCEAWTLALSEEDRLRVFENKVLRRIFGQKIYHMIGGWRRLHSEEFSNLCPLPSIVTIIKSKRFRWTGYVEDMGEKRHVTFWCERDL
jgi:hypothetical protein